MEPLLIYYVKLHKISVYSSGSFNTSRYHHITTHIDPQHPLRLNIEFIDGAEGHIFCYGLLPYPDVISYGMRSCGFHCSHHQGVLPLPACPTCCRHPRDPPLPHGDGTPPRPLADPPLTPRSHYHIGAPTVSLNYTPHPGLAPFPLSLPAPSQ